MKKFLAFILVSLQICMAPLCAAGVSSEMRMNTSNPAKLSEFQRLFAKHHANLTATNVDLAEIDADPLKVIAHKASQLEEGVLVEDTTLDIEGTLVGVNVRWLLDHLEEHIGKKAVWTVLLAYHKDNQVYIYAGHVSGQIVKARGKWGFGFDRVFLPDGGTKTLAESKPDVVNARAYAVDALMQNKLHATMPLLKEWDGAWQ